MTERQASTLETAEWKGSGAPEDDIESPQTPPGDSQEPQARSGWRVGCWDGWGQASVEGWKRSH